MPGNGRVKRQAILAAAVTSFLGRTDMTVMERVRLLDLKFRLESDARTLKTATRAELDFLHRIAGDERRLADRACLSATAVASDHAPRA